MSTLDYYRRTTLGKSLTDALDELVMNGDLMPEHAVRVIEQFDKTLVEVLEGQVKTRANFKGHLHTYRFCDNVWTFILTDAVFQTDGDIQVVDKVKIVAADHKLLTAAKPP